VTRTTTRIRLPSGSRHPALGPGSILHSGRRLPRAGAGRFYRSVRTYANDFPGPLRTVHRRTQRTDLGNLFTDRYFGAACRGRPGSLLHSEARGMAFGGPGCIRGARAPPRRHLVRGPEAGARHAGGLLLPAATDDSGRRPVCSSGSPSSTCFGEATSGPSTAAVYRAQRANEGLFSLERSLFYVVATEGKDLRGRPPIRCCPLRDGRRRIFGPAPASSSVDPPAASDPAAFTTWGRPPGSSDGFA
jgi:hypothetical protein